MANNVEVRLIATDEASAKMKGVGDATSGLGDKLNALSSLPGPVGDAIGRLQGPIGEVSRAFTELTNAFVPAQTGAQGLGAAMNAAMGPVVIVVAGVVAALAALAAAGFKAGDAFVSWADKVDGIKNVTGATAELSSAIAYMGDITGVGGEQIASMFGIFARQMEAAKQAQLDFDAKVKDASDVAAQKIVDLGAASVANIAKLTADAADKIQMIQTSTAESMATFLQESGVRASDYAAKLNDLQQAANTAAEDAQAAHESRMAALAQSRADAVDSANQSQADRHDNLQQRMADIEQQKNDAAQAASDKMTAAKTQDERNIIGSQLQLQLDKLSRQEDKEQAAVDKADARAATQLAKSLARMDAQAAAEEAAYAKQEARDQERYDKQVAAANLAYARQTTAAEDANNKQVIKAMEAEARIANARDVAIAADEVKRNIEQQKVVDALNKMREAGPQNGLIDALKKMNISFEDFAKMDVDTQIKTLFNGLNDVKDSSTRTALEMALFGRGGKELQEVLEYVEKNGFDNIIAKTKASGLSMTDAQIEMAKMANYAKNELQKSLDGVVVKLGEKVTPAITAMNESFGKTWSTYGPQISGALLQVSTNILNLVNAMTQMSNWIANNTGPVQRFGELLQTLNRIYNVTPLGIINSVLTGQPIFRAGGGVVAADGSYIVGENGPERFTPSQSGMISKNVVNNWNYSASYGSVPGNDPQASFALMKAMVSQ